MKITALLLFTIILMGNVSAREAVHQKQAKRNIILDVDASGDDLMAILYLLAQPDVDIKAITIVRGVSDAEKGTEMVLRLLALTGHMNIPVVKGADIPMEGSNVFPEKWQPPVDHPYGLVLPPHMLKPSELKAQDMITSLLKEYKGNISILAFGPLTNIALTFSKEPALAGYVKEVYVSDGAVYVKGAINLEYPVIKNTVAGWNLWADAMAANVVFGSPARITLVPLDLTAIHSLHPVLLKSDMVKQYNSKASGIIGESLSSIFTTWITSYHTGTQISGTEDQAPAWDLVAAEIYCNNDICTEWEKQRIEIKTGDPEKDGQIVEVRNEKPNVRICLRGNQELFDKDLLKTAAVSVTKK